MSNQKTVPIAKATAEQLRAFAQDYLGIFPDANAKVEQLRAQVKEAWGKDSIVVGAAAEQPEAAPAGTPPRPVTAAQQPPAKGKVKVHIPMTDRPGGREPVPVSVNGRAMLIPRGEECEIPYAYYEVLKNAVELQYYELPGGGLSEPQAVQAIPHSVIAMSA